MDGSRSIPGKHLSVSFLLMAAAFIAMAAFIALVPCISDESDGFVVGDYRYEPIPMTDNDVKVYANADITEAKIFATVYYDEKDYDVVEIGDDGFANIDSLVSVTLSEGLDVIGERAFFGCSNLSTVSLPLSLTRINDFAFSQCASLETISIKSKVSYIGDQSFFFCEKLNSIVVDTDNMYYCSDDNVLYDKDKKTLITYPLGKTNTTFSMPNTVETLGKYSMYHAKFSNVSMSNSITKILTCAFRGSNVTSIAIPKNVAKIEDYAFLECKSLESINVVEENNQFSSIDGVLFDSAQTTLITYPAGSKTENYHVPDSVTQINSYAFYMNSYLKEIDFYPEDTEDESGNIVVNPPVLKVIGTYAFFNCESLMRIDLPSTVSLIGKYAFSGCTSLNSVLLPSELSELSNGVFSFCSSIEVFYIPSNVKRIQEEAFYGCVSMEYLYVPSGITVNYNAFRGFYFVDRDCITPLSEYDSSFPGYTYHGNVLQMVQQIGTYSLIHYDENGGSVILDDEMIKYNTTYTFPDYKGKMEGYTFSGWMYGTTMYKAGDTMTAPRSNTIMTAVWVEGVTDDGVEKVEPDYVAGIIIAAIGIIVSASIGLYVFAVVKKVKINKDGDDSWHYRR